MIRLLELAIFAGLAVAVHVAVFAVLPQRSLSGGGGDSGTEQISLLAASPAQAALVKAWNAPPEIAQAAVDLGAPPDAAEAPPDAPGADSLAPRAVALEALPSVADRTAMPIQPEALPRPPTPGGLSVPSLSLPNAPEPSQPLAVQNLAPRAPAPALTRPSAPRGPALAPLSPGAAALPQIGETAAPPKRKGPRPKQRPKLAQPERPLRAPAATPQNPAQAAEPSAARQGSRKAGQTDRAKTSVTRNSTGAAKQAESRSATRERLARWASGIQRRVQRSVGRIGRAADVGKTRVTLSVDRSGRLLGATLRLSSGNASVDREVIRAIRRIRKLPPAPRGLTKPSYTFTLDLTIR